MAVDYVRLEVQLLDRVDNGTAEEAIALVLVPAEPVNVGTAEVILIFDKIEGYALGFQRLDAAVLFTPAALLLGMITP